MSGSIQIHDTAFMTSSYRSSNENLSRDIYAQLWNNQKTDDWIRDLMKEVSPFEPLLHCLRNRFFLDRIEQLWKQREIEILINFGCGFSMYPYLLDSRLQHIEIDTEEIIRYKKKKTVLWESKNLLPERDIHYISTNFKMLNISSLTDQILSLIGDKPSFILLEGVIFFLEPEEINQLFFLFDTIQKEKGLIGSVSFLPEEQEKMVFKNLIQFFQNKIDPNFNYQLIKDSFYLGLKNYDLIEKQNYMGLSKLYEGASEMELTEQTILNEQLYLLKKTQND